jgi:hypothetical protein
MQRRDTDPTSEGALVPVYGGAAREEAGQRPPALDLGPFGLIWAYGWLSWPWRWRLQEMVATGICCWGWWRRRPACCSVALGFTGPIWSRSDLIGTGVPPRVLHGPLGPAGPSCDWCAATGSGQLPPLAVEVVPSLSVVLLPASTQAPFRILLRPHDGCFGETTSMTTSWPWWRMLVGGEFGGVEASTSQNSFASDCPGVMDGVFWEKSLLARPTPTRCRLRVAPFLPGGRCGYPMPTSPCMLGETLGPASPGSSVSLSFLRVLLGTWQFGVRSGVDNLWRAQRLGFTVIYSIHPCFHFLLWACFAVAPAFSFHSRLLLVVSCACYINIAGRKSVLGRHYYLC